MPVLNRVISLFVVFVFLFCSAWADKDENKAPVYRLPVPDALPSLPVVAKPMPHLAEPSIVARATVNRPSTRYGIDVSRYQNDIDWKEVSRDSRVTFVYLKATESTGLVDRTYVRNLQEARQAGLPVGVYHFFSPTTPSHQQLANFFGTVDPRTQDLIPIVDVEVAPRRKSQVASFLHRLRAFVDGVEKHFGCKPMIYTSQNFYITYLAGKFLDCPFMFARYSEDVPEIPDDVRFLVWQFTASGRIRGIEGDVDRSCLMVPYTLDDIRYRPRHK
ncbi:MAG: glycosyl hydrolase family 25 [Bacteroides sp.]|nr:glycosyl hydrolase family 25 [Bacteroides sp.]MCM1446966.1 glycosyl hydrolase family 25 [Bacteroides sp.]